MIRRPLRFAALTTGLIALATLAAATSASAGGCCRCDVGCAEVVVGEAPDQLYVVNHGPVFAGPGHYLAPPQVGEARDPGAYPYVGQLYYPPDGGPVYYPTALPRYATGPVPARSVRTRVVTVSHRVRRARRWR